jgi:hypothetical protein
VNTITLDCTPCDPHPQYHLDTSSGILFEYKYLPSPNHFLLTPLFIHYKIKILNLHSYYQTSSLKKSLATSSPPAPSNIERLRVFKQHQTLSSPHTVPQGFKQSKRKPKLKRADSLLIPAGPPTACYDLSAPYGVENAVEDGIKAPWKSLNLSRAGSDGVYEKVVDGQRARGTGSRG